MPANLSPEYKKSEEAFRAARESRERLDALKEMLRTIPKHKGTEHLQADIKSRIKDLTENLSAGKKGGRRTGPSYTVHPEGAAQIALIGPPNAGKSSLHARLTGSQTDIGPYPLTTRLPIPGMLPHEDVYFQLVDLPPITADYMESWIVNALQPADAIMLVVDVSNPACIDQVQTITSRLTDKKIFLSEYWPGLEQEPKTERRKHRSGHIVQAVDAIDDPFRLELPTLLVANKSDLDPDPDEVAVLEELLGVKFPPAMTSAKTGEGCDTIGPLLFKGLEIVRVYTKVPGRPVKKDRPFTVRHGQTVFDVARLVHKDIARGLRFARVWGVNVYDGQQVGPEHPVDDADVIELHI
jgi:ribosome-interacting GTPase 1